MLVDQFRAEGHPVMRSLTLNLPRTGGPLYRRIAAALRDALAQGLARPGEILPSTRVLADELGVHRNTVIAALAELETEGWIAGEQRRAFRVADPLPLEYQSDPHGAAAPGPGPAPARVHAWDWAREVQLEPFAPADHVRFNFEAGLPDFDLFPAAEFRAHLADVLRRARPSILDYGSPRGHGPLVVALDDYLRRMRGLAGRPVFVTGGSQEAVHLVAQLVVRPGDVVAMDEYTYIPAREAYRAAGARVVGLPLESDGLAVEAFERLARSGNVRLLFLTPLHHFPTTVTMPAAKRQRIYDVASRHGVILFEDDYDHEFHYRTEPPLPMAASDPDGRVIYASTFSKILFPAARIGFLVVPEPVARALAEFRRITTHQNDSIVQDAVARWFDSGGLPRHLARMRRLYRARRDGLVRSITREAAGLGWRFDVPQGGMALWLDTGEDSAPLVEAARQAGIFVLGGRSYRVDGGSSRHLRIGFAGRPPEELDAGIAELARIARGMRARGTRPGVR